MKIVPSFIALAAMLATMSVPAYTQTASPAPRKTSTTTVSNAPLKQQVEAILAEIPKGARVGLLVTTMDGKEVISLRPDERFVPASNTKIFTTAAAYHNLASVRGSAPPAGNYVNIGKGSTPTVTLVGVGDARMSSAPDCTIDCLAVLADAIAARHKRVGDVVGDSRYYVDERWSLGMAWNNIVSRSGAGISALTLDGNEYAMTIKPAATPNGAAAVEAIPYYRITNQVVTSQSGPTKIDYFRQPGSRDILLVGTIAATSVPQRVRFGVEDPAHYAASRLTDMLRERGVTVTGKVQSLYRNPGSAAVYLANADHRLTPPLLSDDIKVTNKDSQNLYAEMMLRRVGNERIKTPVDGGIEAIGQMLDEAGVARTAYDFSDGSGMSTYNRVSPRATVNLLRWITTKPWSNAWRESLPIGGTDGTLSRRFAGTILQGKVQAKTGTVNGATALSGYMTTASGKTLIFSSFINDIPGDASASATMDRALVQIAARN